MEVKLVRVSIEVHRPLAILAATNGETISSVAERAIQRELARSSKITKAKEKKQKRLATSQT